MQKLSVTLILILLIQYSKAQSIADTNLIKQHLTAITKTSKPRNYNNISTLNQVAEYIRLEFAKYADTTYFQTFLAENNVEYKNVVCSFGPKNAKTIVMGAHYDVCGNQEGADDNASGVVGLLELARLLQGKKLNYRIELVAYTLEEPPYFRSEYMGSYIHAQSLRKNNVDVFGMVSMEMIGYYDENKHSQHYPLSFLSVFYGHKGNYITLVNKIGKGKFARKFTNSFKHKATIRTKRFFGPKALTGIDFSDHLNYWNLGYSALMLTDTSFYRNNNYHEKTDTMETLNIPAMAEVINTMLHTLVGM